MIFDIVTLVLLIATLATMVYLLKQKDRRIETLEFELEDRDRAAFRDIQTMFRLKEERDNALLNLEMVLMSEDQRVKDMASALEMVLDG